MCRYALTRYKRHYASFACRKAFKRRNKTTSIRVATTIQRDARSAVC
jgi:hypothetical protein